MILILPKHISIRQRKYHQTLSAIKHSQALFSVPDDDLPFYPYQITFYYYGLIGAIITTLIAIPVSIFSGGDEQIIDRDLLSPIIYPYISDKHKPMSTTTPKLEEDELKNLNVIRVDPISKIRKLRESGKKKINELKNGIQKENEGGEIPNGIESGSNNEYIIKEVFNVINETGDERTIIHDKKDKNEYERIEGKNEEIKSETEGEIDESKDVRITVKCDVKDSLS